MGSARARRVSSTCRRTPGFWHFDGQRWARVYDEALVDREQPPAGELLEALRRKNLVGGGGVPKPISKAAGGDPLIIPGSGGAIALGPSG